MLKFTSTYPRSTKVFEDFKKYVVRASKGNLIRGKSGRFSGKAGALHKSIKGTISKKFNRSLKGRFTGGSQMPSLSFSMLDYGKFVDEGVKGSKSSYIKNSKSPYRFSGRKKTVPVEPIKKWCNKRGISEKLAFVIAKSIYEKGIERTEFFLKPFESRLDGVLHKYHVAIADDIANNFANQLRKKLNKNKLSKTKK